MQPEPQAPKRAILAATLRRVPALGLAFVGSSLYANWLSIEIGDEAQQLTDNALPSAEHLTAAVDDLRDLEAATDDYPELRVEERPAARRAIEDLWKKSIRSSTPTSSFPPSPASASSTATCPGAARARRRDRAPLRGRRLRRPRARARDCRPRRARQANRCARLLRQLVRSMLTRLRRARGASRDPPARVVVDWLLDAVTLLFTMASPSGSGESSGPIAPAARARRLIQRRADELEVFGRRVAHDLLSPLRRSRTA